MKRILARVLIVAIVLTTITIYSDKEAYYAHELNSSTKGFRWTNTTSIYSNKRWINIYYNGQYLNSNWANQLTAAANSWNNSANSRTNLIQTNYSSSKLQLASYVTWPKWAPSTGIAFANIADTNGAWLINLNTGSSNYNIGSRIVAGQIYANPKFDNNTSLSADNKRKTLAHEIGHIMGLGHPTTTVSSIMRAIITDCASNPTSHDISDLATFYSNPPCPSSYLEPTAILSQGTTYSGVYWTQWHLNYRGYGLAVDGAFGPITTTQVHSFQQANNLAVDGYVGPITRSKLKITSFVF
ncbi:MAG: peptidoglycan-binding protein [Peptococcaceae bacterium]|nr:peptidoglycan-binding protein [Peptococcaceae bacterium]